jgi:hypothetical protein
MTIVEEQVVVITDTRPAPPPIFHRLCCIDRTKTLCGVARKNTAFSEIDEDAHTDCFVCDHLWANSQRCPSEEIDHFCPNPNRLRGDVTL